jgi:hypothetical protein
MVVARFLEGKCDEPYIYAVGRLQRVLDGKVKDIANKPMNKSTKKKNFLLNQNKHKKR